MRTAFVLMALAISILLCAPRAGGQVPDARNLAGNWGLRVLVEDLADDVIRYGLTADRLQTDVELKLRKNGILVLPHQDTLAVGSPWLYLNVGTILWADKQAFAYSIRFEFNQSVTRYSYPEQQTTLCIASVWSKGSIGYAGITVIEKAVRERVLDDLDYFINDWLAVNGPNAQGRPKDGKE